MDKQAEQLNDTIKKDNPIIFELLSKKGKEIYFPKKGILGQSADAKGKKINATIAIAVEYDGTPMRLASIAKHVSLSPDKVFPYAPSYGLLDLRKAWKELIIKKNPSLKAKISLPVATNALTHGLSIVGYLFVETDDKIIVTDQYWDNYGLTFENAYGGKLDFFNTFAGHGFDVESFSKKLVGTGKKILLLNFPNNPTGYTPTIEEIKEIVEVIRTSAINGAKIVVICDDAYFGLVFKEGVYKESIFTLLSELHENVLAIKLDGATKEDYVWGFRVGFITYASKGISDATLSALEDKTAGAIRGNISNVSLLSQSLVLEALKSHTYDAEKKEKFMLLKERFEKVEEVIAHNKQYAEYFEALPFNSGYFMCIKLKRGIEPEKVRQTLLQKYDTGVIVIGTVIRIAFSSVAVRDISQLFENLFNACKDCSE